MKIAAIELALNDWIQALVNWSVACRVLSSLTVRVWSVAPHDFLCVTTQELFRQLGESWQGLTTVDIDATNLDGGAVAALCASLPCGLKHLRLIVADLAGGAPRVSIPALAAPPTSLESWELSVGRRAMVTTLQPFVDAASAVPNAYPRLRRAVFRTSGSNGCWLVRLCALMKSLSSVTHWKLGCSHENLLDGDVLRMVRSLRGNPNLFRFSVGVSGNPISGNSILALLRGLPTVVRLSIDATHVRSCRGLLNPCPTDTVQHFRLTLSAQNGIEAVETVLRRSETTFRCEKQWLWHTFTHTERDWRIVLSP